MTKKFLPLLLLSGLAIGPVAAQKNARPAAPVVAYSAAGKKVRVYTTAANTALRLSSGTDLAFQPAGQPLEKSLLRMLVRARV